MPHLSRSARRWVLALTVIALVAAAVRLSISSTPIVGYRVLDDYNLALRVIGSHAQWRGATIEETPSEVSIGLQEISIRGPGFDDDVAYVAVRLHDPLGSRTVVDVLTGDPIPLATP